MVNYASRYTEEKEPERVSAYTISKIPDGGLWPYFKSRVQGDIHYSRLADRIIDLMVLDQAVADVHDSDLIAVSLENDWVTKDEITETRSQPVPRGIDAEDVADETTVTGIPSGVYIKSKLRARGTVHYDWLGDRLLDLIAVDQVFADKYETGVVEYLVENGHITDDDMRAAFYTDIPQAE